MRVKLRKQGKLSDIHFYTFDSSITNPALNKKYVMNVNWNHKREKAKYYLIAESTDTFINENLRLKY